MLLTIIAGVMVYVLSQLFDEYMLKPIHRYTLIKSKVSYSLAYYGNLYMNPLTLGSETDERLTNDYRVASEELRKVAAELKGFIEEKPFLAMFLPNEQKMMKAYHGLVGLSNGLFVGSQSDWQRNNGAYEDAVIINLALHKEK